MSEAKALVTEYLNALSGKPKSPETIARFVSDTQLAQHILATEAAFPSYELIAQDIMEENRKVAVLGQFRGVHRGPFAGIEATGKSVSADLIIIYAVADGAIAQHWMQLDMLSVLEQLKT